MFNIIINGPLITDSEIVDVNREISDLIDLSINVKRKISLKGYKKNYYR